MRRTDNPKPSTIWARNNPDKVRGYIAKRLEKDPEYYKRSAKKWAEEHPDRVKANKAKPEVRQKIREWQKNNPDKVAESSRKYLLKRRFKDDLILEKYQKLYDSQDGKCAICGIAPLDKHLSIDHNHTTGEIRGLLCQSCNLAIGYAKEDILILESMIKYLRDYHNQMLGLS